MRIHAYLCFFLYLITLLCLSPSRAGLGWGMDRKLYAVPCPGPVVIDGQLDDWDWSGHIECYEREETRSTQRAELAVMYDDQALYLGAKVKDLSPMLNRHNPAADADKAWMGDCCQFRLVADRRQSFPFLRGSLGSPDTMGSEVGQPLHLMLWYFTDNKEPALQIQKSFAFAPVREAWGPLGVVPHDHFQAAYRVDDDGKGYTFEYRIPWDTLNAQQTHPRAGDVITATLQFLWGDANGLVNKGCAYDLLTYSGVPYQNSACWGKLIFVDRGISRAPGSSRSASRRRPRRSPSAIICPPTAKLPSRCSIRTIISCGTSSPRRRARRETSPRRGTVATASANCCPPAITPGRGCTTHRSARAM